MSVPARTFYFGRAFVSPLFDAFTIGGGLTLPMALWLLWDGTPRANFWAAILYIGTALTDLIDGYLARKWGQISEYRCLR